MRIDKGRRAEKGEKVEKQKLRLLNLRGLCVVNEPDALYAHARGKSGVSRRAGPARGVALSLIA